MCMVPLMKSISSESWLNVYRKCKTSKSNLDNIVYHGTDPRVLDEFKKLVDYLIDTTIAIYFNCYRCEIDFTLVA